MATRGPPLIPMGEAEGLPDVAVQRPWRIPLRLSRFGDAIEGFLERAGLDRGPWLAVGFAAGIGLWFLLDTPWQWIAVLGALGFGALVVLSTYRAHDDRRRIVAAVVGMAFAVAAGLVFVWARSEAIGAQPIDYPRSERIDGRILEREDQPAQGRTRLILAMRDATTARAMKVRINVPLEQIRDGMEEGARVRLRARLMPPSPPLVPGAYDFARAAWFEGLAATGTLQGEIELTEPSRGRQGLLAQTQRALSAHVRDRLESSPGAIAAAFASGDRGAIDEADETAMRDAGLTHLLSISGVHVSALIAAGYFLAMRLLGLWPWLVLRIRLPLVAAGIGAGAGIAYTLLTGAEVPTVRSCVGALLVLTALAIGREALSMRMVAAAGVLVLALWPEALVGPSFQMSFTAVIAIVALHNSNPVQRLLAAREESWLWHFARRVFMLLVTGVVIELVLAPIVLFHFHRAGLYGAIANVIAIPMVSFVTMPLLAVSLFADLIGAGAPFWWLTGLSLKGLLELAHFAASLPGAIRLVPQVGAGVVILFVTGGFWLALWSGKERLWGLVPIAISCAFIPTVHAPDFLVSRDGQDVALAGEGGKLVVLRAGDSYASENLQQLSAAQGGIVPIGAWKGARCSEDFCSAVISRADREWTILVARSRNRIEERALSAACERSDIVIAARYLPASCQPRWLKADRRFLDREGGLAIYLSTERVDTVAMHQGEHGWWRPTGRAFGSHETRETRSPRTAPPVPTAN